MFHRELTTTCVKPMDGLQTYTESSNLIGVYGPIAIFVDQRATVTKICCLEFSKMRDRYAGRDTPNVSAAEYCRVMFLKDSSE